MLRDKLKSIKSSRKDLRTFGLTMGIFFLLVGSLLIWRKGPEFLFIVILGAVLLLSGFLFPRGLKPIHRVWMTLATIIGWVMTRTVLILLYYLVITPAGLAMRIFGKQSLELKWDASATSYWNHRSPGSSRTVDYERQF